MYSEPKNIDKGILLHNTVYLSALELVDLGFGVALWVIVGLVRKSGNFRPQSPPKPTKSLSNPVSSPWLLSGALSPDSHFIIPGQRDEILANSSKAKFTYPGVRTRKSCFPLRASARKASASPPSRILCLASSLPEADRGYRRP